MIATLQKFAADTGLDPSYLPGTNPDGSLLRTITQYLMGLAAAVALLLIVIGAFQYTLSRGDPAATNKAKNTILYSVIGLVISLGAYGIVTFVAGRI